MTVETLTHNLDTLWIVIASALVIFMQAGFAALEAGLTRAKNSINVAAKNATDLIVSVLVFWMIGYGIMFGASQGGFLGWSNFFFSSEDNYTVALVLFQATFAGTAVTIVSGAVAERMVFSSYAVMALIVTALVYPVSGHWIWSEDGWLAQQGMMDFAGSTVVHSVGAWIGLAGAWLLGPRLGRFDEKGKPNKIHGHSLVLSVVGAVVLLFGWFGFNGGSVLAVDASIALIILNTVLAAAAGGVACFAVSQLHRGGIISVEKLLNGIVGGLVAITACAPWVSPMSAVVIGLIAGVIVYVSEEVVLYVFKVDDPVNVISAHGTAGVWGTIGLVFFVPADLLQNGSVMSQFVVQCIGVATVFAWSFGWGVLIFLGFKMFNRLRVSVDAEEQGLNIHEHGASSTLYNTATHVRRIIEAFESGDQAELDYGRRVNVEQGSDGGDIAELFNSLLGIFEQTIEQVRTVVKELDQSTSAMEKTSVNMCSDAESQSDASEHLVRDLTFLADSVTHIGQQIEGISGVAGNANSEAKSGRELIEGSVEKLKSLSTSTVALNESVVKLKQESMEITDFLSLIHEIADQTNLLALNAAIEAARAGELGRGFAVVADEVRKLSKRTQEAAYEINTRIDSLNEKVDGLVQGMEDNVNSALVTETSIEETGDRFSSILALVEQTREMVEATSAYSSEGEKRNALVRSRIDEIASRIQSAKANASDVSESSELLNSLAIELKTVLGLHKEEKTLGRSIH